MRIPKHVIMAFLKNSSDLLPERRVAVGGLDKSQGQGNCGLRSSRRGRRFGRIPGHKILFWSLSLALLLLICLAVFGFSMFHVSFEAGLLSLRKPEASSFEYVMRKAGNASFEDEVKRPSKKARRQRFYPCDVLLLRSVNYFLEPKESLNVTDFPLRYTEKEEIHSHDSTFHPRFAGHQTLGEREKAFYAGNQSLHCGFVKGPKGFESTGFDLDEEDKKFMRTCTIAVSSCIFGNSDFLRRPTRKLISGYSERNICFVMFVDEQTLSTLSAEGKVPDDRGYIGLWRIVVVRNLPYKDLRKTGKVPKFLSHRLFPSSRYSIWLDSKLRLVADPMKIIEYFLWRTGSEYAISNHYTRHCVWEEVIQNKRLNKYDHRVIDEQFNFYRSDGLVKFNQSDPDVPLPSYVPEGSFIVRAHSPMSNLFSCLWFNEVDRFTSRDQLSFAYTYLKLRRSNPDKPFHLHMFKDCERRALVKLFHHREL